MISTNWTNTSKNSTEWAINAAVEDALTAYDAEVAYSSASVNYDGYDPLTESLISTSPYTNWTGGSKNSTNWT